MTRLFYLISFLRFIVKRFNDVGCVQMASSLTFTTLLSLVPLITITLTVIAAFPVFSELTVQLKIFILSNLVPESAGKVITVYMQQFSENATRLTALGIAFLGVTAIMLMLTIERAFNVIWRVLKQRTLLNRVLVYWAVLTLGPLMIGSSLSLTSYLVSLSLGLANVPEISVVMLKVMPVVLTTVAFALLFMAVPNRFVPWSHAFTGAVVAGLAFELMKKFFALYVTHFGSYNLVYGTFAIFPIFLLWIYFSWLVVLLGAVIASSLSYWRGGAWKNERVPGRQLYDALHILNLLYLAYQKGETIDLRQMRKQVHLGFDELEEILERLEQAKWIRRVAGNGWALVANPEKIQVGEVYELFVFRSSHFSATKTSEDNPLDTFIQGLANHIGSEMNKSLKLLFEENDENRLTTKVI